MLICVSCGSGIQRAELQVTIQSPISSQQDQTSDQSAFLIPDQLGKLRETLERRTKVPLRLPVFSFPKNSSDIAAYAIIQLNDESGYEIQLAATDDCGGQNYCHEGTLRGSVDELEENEGPRIPVKLANGIEGYFVESTCGAHCDDSSIGWREGKYHYSISMKAERLARLRKLADSAILSAAGNKQRSRTVGHK